MTEGVLWKQIVRFTVPLLIGNIFQQLYNTVDSIVVGNFVGKEALAAVGSTSMIINMLIGFFSGLATGATVVVSHYFGARDDENLHRAVHTTIAMTLLLGVVFTGVGIALTPSMLRLMSTPDDVFGASQSYLTVYFSGVIGLMIYNMGAGVLRAVGDSRNPLYFLCVSSVVNIGLDILFVPVFKMGVEGVALATIIAQFVSAALVLVVLARAQNGCRLVVRDIRLHRDILGRIFKIGLPAAIQSAIVSFSNVFVQKYINAFGSSAMAGWTTHNKIDQFISLPVQSIGIAATTCVGQNLGAGKRERAERSTKVSLTIGVCVTLALTAIAMLAATPLLKIFNSEADVIEYGRLFIMVCSPFYVFSGINQILAGSLRGSGDSRTPTLIMIISFVPFRQLYLFVSSRLTDSIIPISLGYPVGWMMATLLLSIHYARGKWRSMAPVISAAPSHADKADPAKDADKQ